MIKKANVGTTDRTIRIVAGAVLIALPLLSAWTSAGAKWGAIAVGAVLIITALIRFCPAYRIVGASTCSAPRN